MKKNVALLKLYMVFQQPLFFLAVVYPYYLARDIDIGEFFLVTAFWTLGALLTELPAGYLSDRFSRRGVLMLSAVVGIVHFSLLYVSHGVWLFGLADFLGGVSFALMSGTDAALLYEILEEGGRKKDYARHDGQMRAYALYALAGSVVLGGFIYAHSPGLTVILAGAGRIVALICAFYMIEPARHTRHVYQKISLSALAQLFSDYRVLALFILSAVLFEIVPNIGEWVKIAYFPLAGVPVRMYGILIALYLLFHALGAHLGPALWKKAGWRGFVLVILALTSLTYLPPALMISPWGLAALTGVLFVLGLGEPVLRQKINDAAPPGLRASTFSLKAFLEHFTAMAGFLLVSGLIETGGVQPIFFAFWLILIAVSLYWLFARQP